MFISYSKYISPACFLIIFCSSIFGQDVKKGSVVSISAETFQQKQESFSKFNKGLSLGTSIATYSLEGFMGYEISLNARVNLEFRTAIGASFQLIHFIGIWDNEIIPYGGLSAGLLIQTFGKNFIEGHIGSSMLVAQGTNLGPHLYFRVGFREKYNQKNSCAFGFGVPQFVYWTFFF